MMKVQKHDKKSWRPPMALTDPEQAQRHHPAAPLALRDDLKEEGVANGGASQADAKHGSHGKEHLARSAKGQGEIR